MLIDCTAIADTLDQEIKKSVMALSQSGIETKICQVVATENKGVTSYSATLERKATRLGIKHHLLRFTKEQKTEVLIEAVRELNARKDIHGIVVGMPTFPELDSEKIINSIVHTKDIDGLGPMNTYYLHTNQEHLGISPATAIAAMHIIETLTTIAGRRIAVIGRGRTVGRPLAAMLTNRDATVTLCHSRTPDIDAIIDQNEIVVSAVGRPHGFRPDWIRPDHIVIDCGISFIEGKTAGDFDSEAIAKRGARVTPVPGGVGAVTNSIIFWNLIKAIRLQTSDK